MSGRRSRREFLGLTAAGASAAFVPPWISESGAAPRATPGGAPVARFTAQLAAQGVDPDLVVLNAKVYTMDPALPRTEAFAVSGGRIVAVGPSGDIRALVGKRTQVYDAQQMTVVPGFIDCHNHPRGTTLLYEVLVGNPFEVEFVTIDSIVEKLKARAATVPPGTWVSGYFHDDTKLKDKRPLRRQDLDRVSTEHPVVVRHRGGHTSFYNTKALEMAKVTRETPNPPGGTFDRDANGDLTGRVTDRATSVFSGVGRSETFSP
ncbi:MAG: amidohydrolase family protein, partial [Gemmatimonadota bacterium]|nr:amidohydrolase family protein [Gemmatimonadota bacterium]